MTDNAIRFGKVAVLLGGSSGERAVSLNSGRAIVAALKEQGVNAHAVDSAENVIGQLVAGNFERVFIALHGKGGEDGVIQGVLETMGLPYTGSGILGSAIGMDKLRSKTLWGAEGLKVIPAESIKAHKKITKTQASQMLSRQGMKVMVKPSAEGSSLGMSKVESAEKLIAALDKAAFYGGDILIEQWINGPEYTVSLLNGKALPVIQIKTAREFYDYAAKYEETGTEYLCPTDLSKAQEHQLQEMALKAFELIACDGWGRVDFIQNKNTEAFYLLEANTVPGMTDSSLVPMAAKAAGMKFPELVLEILKTSEVSLNEKESSHG